MLSTEQDRDYCNNKATVSTPYFRENQSSSQQILSEVQLLENLIEQASIAYADGDLQKALSFYEQAVLVDPANNVLYANRSAIYLKLGFLKEALDEACHSIQLNPDWPKAYFRKGEALKEAKLFEKAVVAYSQALQLSSENEKFLSVLISCAQKSPISGFFNDAYVQMKELSLEKSPFVVISVIGQGFLAIGNYETSIVILKIALNIDSPSLKLKESTFGALAKAYYEADNFSKAQDYLELQLELLIQLSLLTIYEYLRHSQISDDAGAQIEIHDNIAKIAMKQNNFELALLHRDNQIILAEKLGSSSTLFKVEKAELLEKMGEIRESVDFCKELLTEGSSDFDVNMRIGNLLIKQNFLKEAMTAFEKAKESTNNSHPQLLALIRISQCKLLLGDEEGSIRTLKENLKNEDVEILGNVLRILCKSAESSGDIFTIYRMAKRQLKLGMESKNERILMEAHFSLATFYEMAGQRNTAKQLLRLYLEKMENNNLKFNSLHGHISALSRLGRIEFEDNNIEVAIQVTVRRLDLIPDDEVEMKALAHSDLVSIYRKTKETEKREKHLQEIKKLVESKNNKSNCSWIYEKEMANYYLDKEQWAEAKYILEQTLISVQEINNNEHEAEICKKLGIIHLKLEQQEEAIFYFNQFLMIVQQKKDIIMMSEAHFLLAEAYMDIELWEEALNHARCRLTLSSILNQQKGKISSFIILGRIFEKKDKPEIALKVLQKAKILAEKSESKEELAICYGLLGEAHLKLGYRKKALSNFCKQLSYFSFIHDVELKCQSIKHLIEDKAEGGDVAWTTKLIRLQQTIAKEGRPNLQIDVQRSSANVMYQLGMIDEAISSLEKALVLSIQHEHNDTVAILLELCEYYSATMQYYKGIKALENFAELQDGLCGPAVYYNLGLLYLKEGKIDKCLEVLEKCKEFDAVDQRFMYVLACAYYRKKDFDQALHWLDKVLELPSDDPVIQEKLLWERFSLSIRCENQVSINEELYSLIEISTGPIHIYLDELNLYDHINPTVALLLPETAKIHLAMYSMDYKFALDLIQSSRDPMSLIFENLVTNYFLGFPESLSTHVLDVDGDNSLSLFAFNEELKEDLIVFIHALSVANSLIDSLFLVEKYRWKKTMKTFVAAGISYCVPEPVVEDVEIIMQELDSFVYCFEVFGYSLLWIKNSKNDLIQMFHKIKKESNSRIPLFYDVIMDKAVDMSELPEITEELNPDFAIGNIFRKKNQPSLINYYSPRIKPMAETAVLFIGEESEAAGSVSLNPEDISTMELIARISEASVAYIDVDRLNPEDIYLSSLFRSEMALRVAILRSEVLEGRTQRLVEVLLQSSCQYIIVVEESEKNLIENLFCKKIYNRLDINQLLSSITGKYTYFTVAGSPSTIEVIGLSPATRSILSGKSHPNEKYGLPERYQLTISKRIEQILAETDITAFDHMDNWENDKYPFNRMREFIQGKYEINHLLFGDFLVQPKKQIQELTNDEICQLMKSFEVRKKWRRSRKMIADRNCHSEGEQLPVYSDKDLTDTESVSGARVIGIEKCDDVDYLY